MNKHIWAWGNPIQAKYWQRCKTLDEIYRLRKQGRGQRSNNINLPTTTGDRVSRIDQKRSSTSVLEFLVGEWEHAKVSFYVVLSYLLLLMRIDAPRIHLGRNNPGIR